jgi:hypothetical protein
LVRRLLQLGVLLLSLAALLTPLVELFDRWDPPGPPASDTELSVFALIFLLCLILLVSKLIATLSRQSALVTLSRIRSFATFPSEDGLCFISLAARPTSPPLRI